MSKLEGSQFYHNLIQLESKFWNPRFRAILSINTYFQLLMFLSILYPFCLANFLRYLNVLDNLILLSTSFAISFKLKCGFSYIVLSSIQLSYFQLRARVLTVYSPILRIAPLSTTAHMEWHGRWLVGLILFLIRLLRFVTGLTTCSVNLCNNLIK